MKKHTEMTVTDKYLLYQQIERMLHDAHQRKVLRPGDPEYCGVSHILRIFTTDNMILNRWYDYVLGTWNVSTTEQDIIKEFLKTIPFNVEELGRMSDIFEVGAYPETSGSIAQSIMNLLTHLAFLFDLQFGTSSTQQ